MPEVLTRPSLLDFCWRTFDRWEFFREWPKWVKLVGALEIWILKNFRAFCAKNAEPYLSQIVQYSPIVKESWILYGKIHQNVGRIITFSDLYRWVTSLASEHRKVWGSHSKFQMANNFADFDDHETVTFVGKHFLNGISTYNMNCRQSCFIRCSVAIVWKINQIIMHGFKQVFI